MKKLFILLFLGFASSTCLQAEKQFVSSIYFQQPDQTFYQLMYSTQPLDSNNRMIKVFKWLNNGIGRDNFNNLQGYGGNGSNWFQSPRNDMFDQYVTTGYFLTGAETLYITHPTAPATNSINLVQLRMATASYKNATGTAVSSNFHNSYGLLMDCFIHVMAAQRKDFTYPYYAKLNWNGINKVSNWDTWVQRLGQPVDSPSFSTTLKQVIKNIPPIATTARFSEQLVLNRNSFTPVGGVNMKTETYFGDHITFNLNLITPGKRVSIGDGIAFIMESQNTYNELYPLKGDSKCGDNFGF